MAKAFLMVGSHERADTCLAGAEALDAVERVRRTLAGLRGQREAALQRWDDTGDPWDGATSDTLHDTIHLLIEDLKGDTE
jgi:hypothetical protein